MNTNLESFKNELSELIKEGRRLYYSLIVKNGNHTPEQEKKLNKLKLPDFVGNYEQWYSRAYVVIKQILPERLDDFQKLYKNDKRKQIDFLTYTISDCLLGLVTRLGSAIKADESAAIPKVDQQVNILESAEKRFESKLFDIVKIVQSDLFDSELDASKELLKNGFLRGAGAIAGVVLEKHLSEACLNHKITIKKKDPTISDLNDLLKKGSIIEVPLWRFIQHLGDLRNLCDHNKKREPTKEEVNELIDGVQKMIKTLF
jgi:uncharacterized protein (UPF0332 family)